MASLFYRSEARRLLTALACALAIHAGVALLVHLSGAGSGGQLSVAATGSRSLRVSLAAAAAEPGPTAGEPIERAPGPGEKSAETVPTQRTKRKAVPPQERSNSGEGDAKRREGGDEEPQRPLQADSPQNAAVERIAPAVDPRDAPEGRSQSSEPATTAAEERRADAPGSDAAEADTAAQRGHGAADRPLPDSSAGTRVDAAGGSDAAAAERSLAEQIGELIEERKVYPESARRRGLEGDVVFQLKIYPDGRLRSLSLVESPRGPLLSRAAERLVRSIFPLRSPQQWDSHSCRVAVRYRLN